MNHYLQAAGQQFRRQGVSTVIFYKKLNFGEFFKNYEEGKGVKKEDREVFSIFS